MHTSKKDRESPSDKGVLPVTKRRGETLAKLIQRVREEYDISPDIPVTYAGRLDPMAEGIVLLLTGDTRFQKDAYSAQEKEYKFQILFGISTDTYDPLGNIIDTQIPLTKKITKELIEEKIKEVLRSPLPYPPFSSKPVQGKPLFVHARADTLPESMPLQHGTVLTYRIEGISEIPFNALVEEIVQTIALVEGDFRQQETIAQWHTVKEKYGGTLVSLATITATVSSGVYIRSISSAVGESITIPSIAYRIKRTRVGTYCL